MMNVIIILGALIEIIIAVVILFIIHEPKPHIRKEPREVVVVWQDSTGKIYGALVNTIIIPSKQIKTDENKIGH